MRQIEPLAKSGRPCGAEITIFATPISGRNRRVLRDDQRVAANPIPAAAASSTTSSGGARQTVSKTKPAAAIAKSAGSRTALTHTGL
jgi:hypothetical protein